MPHFLTKRLWWFGLVLGVGALAIALGRPFMIAQAPRAEAAQARSLGDAFDGAKGWINSKPLRLADLKGKIVLLDFWTYCCINCHHILPDLAKLEAKYKNELVVIGVHTAKFPAERVTENIRKKVNEYRIKHPVANDADQTLWNRFGVNSWPTLVLIDAAGKPVGSVSGEGQYAVLDRAIGALVEQQRGIINQEPLVFFAESEKPHDKGLLFPGKILADEGGNRLFISDTGHNRIVITDLQGKFLDAVGNGEEGLKDGGFDRAKFNRPQGMCLFEGKLYVADTENHAIRAVDLDSKSVATVAGNGSQGYARKSGSVKEMSLNSPWDVLPMPKGRTLAIAMAGPHQIWSLDLDDQTIGPFAGTGIENIKDGTLETADFAQPSGLATDGKHLFVADSETSSLRMITLATEKVHTIVGQGLFVFGDRDGQGNAVRLQHCLGVAFGDGKLYIADSYNSKIKVSDPFKRTVHTLAGNGKAGANDSPARFDQPGGLSLIGLTLYVADTNNNAIRTIDLKTKQVATLDISTVSPPAPPQRVPTFPNATVFEAPETKVTPGQSFTLNVALELPKGFKLNPEAPAPIRYLLEAPGHDGALGDAVSPTGDSIESLSGTFSVPVPLTKSAAEGDELALRLSISAFMCKEGDNAYCTFKNYVWKVPIQFAEEGEAAVTLSPSPEPRTR
ncbi:MAG: thioredoxin-like domain-containing protein [Isosphaeraceae bacterium]